MCFVQPGYFVESIHLFTSTKVVLFNSSITQKLLNQFSWYLVEGWGKGQGRARFAIDPDKGVDPGFFFKKISIFNNVRSGTFQFY